ncbi:hypothetical protein L3Q67_45330 (plasmid) [Saccharothrix sp. AJ9571]|nr:hypothetical protein L3Q67_45330 [Saccharothrix sp. AJ9571]
MAGRTGTMREVSRMLLAAHAKDEGHWTHDHTEQSLSKRLADFLGRGARRAPRWSEIEELFAAYLPQAQREPLLALAAGAFVQAYGHPPHGYTGPVERPGWVRAPVVNADTIRTAIHRATRLITVGHPGDTTATATSGEANKPASATWSEERSKLKEISAISNRAFMELLRQLEDKETLLRCAVTKAQRSEAARDLHRQMTSSMEGSLLWEMAEDAQAKEHPALSREQVRNLMYEQLRQLADDQLA